MHKGLKRLWEKDDGSTLPFEQVFKIAAIFWLDLQRDFDLWKIKDSGKIHLKPLTDLRA